MTIGIFSGWSISRILDKFSTSHVARNDEWNSDRPKEDGSKYDGPAGMEPDGVIDSNWEEVEGRAVVYILIDIFPSRSVRTSMT